MGNIPYLWELAETKLKHAEPRDKTINIKIAINTARMMVDRESSPLMVKLLKTAVKYLEHPDVKSIPFAMSSEHVAKQIYKILAEIEGRE